MPRVRPAPTIERYSGSPCVEGSDMTRILVVANRTASTPALLAEVNARARVGASVTVLIPPEKSDHPDWTEEEAARLVGDAADQQGGGPDARGGAPATH